MEQGDLVKLSAWGQRIYNHHSRYHPHGMVAPIIDVEDDYIEPDDEEDGYYKTYFLVRWPSGIECQYEKDELEIVNKIEGELEDFL